jgi:type II secretory pathway component PulF
VGSVRSAFGATISERTLGHFFANLARMIGSGVAIPTAVKAASAGLGDELPGIAEAVEPKMRSGTPLHLALVPFRNRFPEVVLPVLEVGEVSGTLDDACLRLARLFQEINGFNARFKGVAIEPIKVILAGVMFKTFFAVLGGPWVALQVAVWTAVELIAVYLILRLLQRNLWRWPALHVLVDKVHLAIPHVGAIERNLGSARWARSFATMWHAGVPISQSLDVSSRSTLNAYYERELQRAVAGTRAGKSLTESLEGIELTPQHLLPLLKVGEETARFGDALDKFVEVLEDEALVKAQQEAQAAMVIGYLIVGLIVLLIAFGAPIPFL